MDKKWLLGFIEATGCFSVIIRKSKTKIGYQTTMDFTIRLPKAQKPLLEKIQHNLGIGKVYISKRDACLKATNIQDARKLVAFFRYQEFVSDAKKAEFAYWKKCLEHIKKGRHLSKTGVLDIALLRDAVHSKNQWNKKSYCALRNDLDPCKMYSESGKCRICFQKVKV